MRTAIILGWEHGSKNPIMLSGPDVHIQAQLVEFKEYRKVSTHPELARVELWTSDAGRIKYRELDDPEAVVKREKDAALAKAKAESEAKKKEEDEAKAKAESEAKKKQSNPSKK